MAKFWDKVKETAPTIAMALDKGLTGGVLTGIASSVFGWKGKGDIPATELKGLIMANPDKLVELQMLEKKNAHELAMLNRKLDYEEERMHVDDRGSARERDYQVAKSDVPKAKKIFPEFLAVAVIILTFTFWGLIIFKGIPEASKEIAYIICGALTAEFTRIMVYYFGSSKGSKDKTDVLSGFLSQKS